MSPRVLGEGLGTGLLLFVIVGSGIAAADLGSDRAVVLFTHAVAVGLGLGTLIAMFQSVSGSHFNPSVTLAFWRSGVIGGREAARFIIAQSVGAVIGVVAANLTFHLSAISIASTDRAGSGLVLAEAISTFVLVLAILALVRTGRSTWVPVAVGAWVGAIVFATSSTGFANPAVTLARVVTDTYTGISPLSVFPFLLAQVLGGLAAAAVAPIFYPASVPIETAK